MFLFACKFNRHKVANSLQGMFREELERNSLNIERKSLHVCQQFLYRIGGATCPNRKRSKLFHPHPQLHHLLEKQTGVYMYQLLTFQCLGQEVVQKKSPVWDSIREEDKLALHQWHNIPTTNELHVFVSLTSQIHFRSGSGLRDCAFVQCIALCGGKYVLHVLEHVCKVWNSLHNSIILTIRSLCPCLLRKEDSIVCTL